jgi:hypothetical protein
MNHKNSWFSLKNAMPKMMTMYHKHFHGKHYDIKMAMDCGID